MPVLILNSSLKAHKSTEKLLGIMIIRLVYWKSPTSDIYLRAIFHRGTVVFYCVLCPS